MKHEIKITPNYFEAVKKGIKPWEIRKNDRNYKVGDNIILKEYDLKLKKYTGRRISGWIEYILEGGKYGLSQGFVIMTIKYT
ncbi:hypothetical protein BWZ22_00855 [Seonamhaeicola sp. S2-3]|uniref:DUF3850 domain-containing protein n=1 Tax=Seonamhaeicola sp. S2-3 TaxID=1936081 RepID=UPI0009728D5C|nr:DUF3850 domain-containing protein [Seonamhaeicola sp. S2-3]APY09878.1 hypothetical protein BWZ22_00855 [Seonamhaeicola sp. S2-3]